MARFSIVLALGAGLLITTGAFADLKSPSTPSSWRVLKPSEQQDIRGGLCFTCTPSPGFVCTGCTCAGVPCNLTSSGCQNAAGQTAGCTNTTVVWISCTFKLFASCTPAIAYCGNAQNPVCTFGGGSCPCACTNTGSTCDLCQ